MIVNEPIFLNRSLPPGVSLRLFPSTVQIVHTISPYREVVAAEFPLPYDPQGREWWTNRVFEELQPYLNKYGVIK